MSLSKNKLKYIRSLQTKKARTEHATFVAEGDKLVADLLHHLRCQLLLVVEGSDFPMINHTIEEIIYVSEKELTQASSLQNPQHSLAVFYQPSNEQPTTFDNQLYLALDDIQDPGNLGTIIRIADWYGISHIFCSLGTVDVYNSKVVQATMGALARVKVHYVYLPDFLTHHKNIPIYGTLLDGDNVYTQPLTANGILVMGNEGNGISHQVAQLIQQRLYIPSYPLDADTSESLNVSIATAIICAEFRRRIY